MQTPLLPLLRVPGSRVADGAPRAGCYTQRRLWPRAQAAPAETEAQRQAELHEITLITTRR